MRISDLAAAKRMKFKLLIAEPVPDLKVNDLLKIDATNNTLEYLVTPYGRNFVDKTLSFFARTTQETSFYIQDCQSSQNSAIFYPLYVVESTAADMIEIQTYVFEKIVPYEVPITIQIPQKLADTVSIEKLQEMYIWTDLGRPAVFCLNYRNKKKNKDELRFLSRNAYLHAESTPRGIVVTSNKPAFRKADLYESLMVNLYSSKKIEFVIDNGLSGFTDRSLMDTIGKISAPNSYIERWQAYEKLSEEVLKEESKEFGSIHYTSFDEETDINQTTYVFHVKEQLDKSNKGTSVAVIPLQDDEEEEPEEKPTEIGVIDKITETTISTVLPASDKIVDLPSAGQIILSTRGNKAIAKRRHAAEDRIMKHESAIRYLGALIEAGVSEFSPEWTSEKPITSELEQHFPNAKQLNDKQKRALDIAINTPDIALIQGPPGTGKTTVIKAIQERFRELFERDELRKQQADPEYVMKSPRILVSSFQNEAVDNAVSKAIAGEMPASRRTNRKDIKEQYAQSLFSWYENLKNSLEDRYGNNGIVSERYKNKMQLGDQYFAYKKAGEPIELAVELIKYYLELGGDSFSPNTVTLAKRYLEHYGEESSVVSEGITDNALSELLTKQRTNKEAYIDDGEENLGQLIAHLKSHQYDDITKEDQDLLTSMYFEDGPESPVFSKYATLIVRLQDKYCIPETRISFSDPDELNHLLNSLKTEFDQSYHTTSNDINIQKADIIQEFLFRLEEEFEELVDKYSATTAATCQGALDLFMVYMNGNETFDLVIIDEAARANPLDLLIPMSMGKKLILVGDHKQLPHMLEPDVVAKLKAQPDYSNIDGLEVSLFERLFDMFLTNDRHTKSIKLDTQYRMHPVISDFVSRAFYSDDGGLQAGVSAEDRASPKEINGGIPLVFINVPKSSGPETKGGDSSRKRVAEVSVVMDQLKNILAIDTNPKHKIGIITFYSAQAKLLRDEKDTRLDDEEKARVEINTVDAFQGKEFDYVILSCVRSNDYTDEEHSVGFLVKPNRVNVAFSRALRQLIVCGDQETLSKISYFKDLIEFCKTQKGGRFCEY